MSTATLHAVNVPEATYLGDWEVASPEWHAARRERVGGSEVAPILGLSPWDSYFSLWHRKRGAIGEQDENPEMRWGNLLEDVICREFANRHPDLDVLPAAGTWVHRERGWQLANPDRLAVNRDTGQLEVVEAKTARDDHGWGEEGTDQIPVYYRAQCLHYLDVFGLDVCRVPVLISGSDYREYEVRYDETDALIGRDAAAAFLDTLRRNERPNIDAHTATLQTVRELHPDIADIDVEIPPALRDEYQGACEELKAAEGAKTYATSLVLDAIGDGRRAVCLGERVAMRVPTAGENKPPHLRPAQARTTFPTTRSA